MVIQPNMVRRSAYEILIGKPEGIILVGYVVVDGRITLKWTSKE
jgi:hypothetical protein